MRLKAIQIRNFRNIKDVTFEPDDHLSLILGQNGQGKTSLIEGVYYLCRQESFRTNNLKELIKKEEKTFWLNGHLQLGENPRVENIQTALGDLGKKIELNGKTVRKSQLSTKSRAVVFSPESLQLIKGSPESRRDLIDSSIVQIFEEAYLVYKDYGKLVRFKNTWLKQIKNQEIGVHEGLRLLESIEEQYLNRAAEILYLRKQYLKKIIPIQKEIFHKITGQNEELLIEETASYHLPDTDNLLRLREQLREALKDERNRKIDIQLGRTVSGPHTHDFVFFLGENEVKNYCSQGQQRAVILAFKIAELVYHKNTFGSYPLLLLDDVLSELDSLKREYLIYFLSQSDAQTFLTSTDLAENIGNKIFKMNAGKLIKV